MNSYIVDQNDNYRLYGDYGQNLSGPRHQLKKCYNRIIISCLDDKHINIVDNGCGNGTLVNILNTKFNKNARGIDTSEVAISMAKELYPDNDYYVGDGRTWAPKNKVDVVIIASWFYRINHNKIKSLKHIYSYIKRGGIIVFDYGWDKFLVEKEMKLYKEDLGKDIFSIFKKRQIIYWQMIDNSNGEEMRKKFYVGEK